MRIDYTVLWFDDSREFTDSVDTEPLRTYLESIGFNLQIVFVHDNEEFESQAPYTQFDLLAVDFNLEAKETGDAFIKQLQENNVYTEVVFYSANASSQLWEAVKERQIEGVFIANRRQVVTKLRAIAKQSVRKVLDLANMRGLVMAGVADLDLLLGKILEKSISLLSDDGRNQVYQRFVKAGLEQISEHGQRYAKFESLPTIEGLLALCDSDKRWQNINRVKSLDKNMAALCRELGNFSGDVLSPRNHLAHGIGTLDDAGVITFMFSGRSYVFDESESISLRKKIAHYRREFEKILTSLEDTNQPAAVVD